MVRMTVAHVGVDRSTNTPVVVLKEAGGPRTLQIWIGAPEANAIAQEIRGEKPARPMTHDLLAHILAGLGGSLERAAITGLKDNTYFAHLLVLRDGQAFEVDARPSDSIALALRAEAPIVVAEELLGEAPGGGEAEPEPPPREGNPEALRKFLSKLDPEDLGRFHP